MCVVRILMYFFMIFVFAQWTNNPVLRNFYVYNAGYIIAIYIGVLIGTQQNFNMLELSIRIKS